VGGEHYCASSPLNLVDAKRFATGAELATYLPAGAVSHGSFARD
jgi:hypothetical protein